MINILSIKRVLPALVLALPLLLAGCGKSSQHSVSGGGAVTKKNDQYKGQDQQLVDRSDRITVASSPEIARKQMRRGPDEVIEEGNGAQTVYYNADPTLNSERLRLRYQNNKLVGKEIVPPDANADPRSVSASAANIKSNEANYANVQEYDPKAKTRPNYRAMTPSDDANAAQNNDFNNKLNSSSSASSKRY